MNIKSIKQMKFMRIVGVLLAVFFIVSITGCNSTSGEILSSQDDQFSKAIEMIDTAPVDAKQAFTNLGDYNDSDYYLKNLYHIVSGTISAGFTHSVALKKDGTVVATEYKGEKKYYDDKCEVGEWIDVVQVATSSRITVALKADGTAYATSSEKNRSDYKDRVEKWTDLIMVACGENHVLGLKKDGSVVSVGDNSYGQCKTNKWSGITQIAASGYYSMGLKDDGTVVYCGDTIFAGMGLTPYKIKIDKWKDIIAIDVSDFHMVGLKNDGTVVATGNTERGQCDTKEWRDIVAVSAGDAHTVGLRSDGTVAYTSFYQYQDDEKSDGYKGQCDVTEWTDIVAISAGSFHTIGLKKDGTLVGTRYKGYKPYDCGQDEVNGWADIGLNDISPIPIPDKH